MEMLMKDADALLSFCFDYMPSSVEILEPDRVTMKNSEFTDFINDMLSRNISLNTSVLEMGERVNYYIKNTAVLLRNFIIVLLSSRPMTLKQVSQYLGVKEDNTLKVIEVLIKEGKVKKKGEQYSAVEKKNE
jgi:putative ribosome biogenesis GTPase RsgA